MFDSYINESILKRAREKGLIKISFVNPRDFTEDKHHKVDDRAYGGGPGMVFKAEPVIKAVESIKLKIGNCPPDRMTSVIRAGKLKIIILSAGGKQFTNSYAKNISKKYDHIILICGRYEGIDARVKSALGGKVEEVSIGPYVLNGGELAAMVVAEAVSRQIPGVLGKEESIEENRLGAGVPVYTRPEVFEQNGKKYRVPKVLLGGNHAKIEEWRKKKRLNISGK
jgi:tRNA (guanine37-N1)-methyltransferase